MRINKKNVEDFYPLSPMQQGMLFHSLYDPDSGVYVEQTSCTLRGYLNTEAFEYAWQQVVDRHPILRTAFVGEGLKEPVQVVHRRVVVPFEHNDWRAYAPANQDDWFEEFLQEEREQGFIPSQPPLMRLALIQTANDTFRFVWTYHHALLDGWSGPLLLGEVFALYDATCRGESLDLPTLRPYRDYIAWLKRQNMDQAEAFWRRTLAGLHAPTPLVVDHLASKAEPELDLPDPIDTYAELEIQLPIETTATLQALVREHQITMNTLVQGAWALLLSRYNGTEDVVFGTTVSGRPTDLPGAESMIGLFINTLPVRIQIHPEQEVASWLQNIQAHQVELRQYEYTPLVQIQGWSEVPRHLPLFESILVFENYPIKDVLPPQRASLDISDIHTAEQTNYPLTLVAGMADTLVLKIIYASQRFDRDTIDRMLGHWVTILEGFATEPYQPLATVPLLTPIERQLLLVDWNATQSDFPADRCIHQLFEARVELHPAAIAVIFEQDQLTYGELNRRANQLAHYLQHYDVGPETLVGICVERSLDMIVGILGVLKAGAAYVPLDPTYPPERLAFMLDDAHASILLTQETVDQTPWTPDPNQTSGPGYQPDMIISLDTDWAEIARQPVENPSSLVQPDNLAYVIYTSGSTGQPKGTLLEHRGLCNLVHTYAQQMGIGIGTRVFQFFAFGFDGSVNDIFATLTSGATLCLVPREAVLSPATLAQLLRTQRVNLAMLPPSLLAMLPPENLPDFQTVISGGENCTPDLVARWLRDRRFFNAYGPTETTVVASWYQVRDRPAQTTAIPIGQPIANAQFYILDHRQQPVPVGVPGELHIGGVGLARGYLNRPDLTSEKFIPHPFSTEPGARLYRTGDLVRYRADGNVDFLGRIDHQVKIRGFRIELGEIEAVLQEHPAVQHALVLAREDIPGDKQLVAYIVTHQQAVADGGSIGAQLRSFLQPKLPGYMIPTVWIDLDTLPLTPNGKVDRKALPAPDGGRRELDHMFIAPRDAMEHQLAQIWEDVLGIRPVGVTDTFFDLGGHSLLAVRIIAQVQQQIKRDLSLMDLFHEPTIEGLARLLRQDEGLPPASALVGLQTQGTRPPLFFIHPSGGSVHWYLDLARLLGRDQPFYGLQARGINGDEPLHTCIEEMATYYIEAMRTVQPEGPYYLGSWSLGVILAFEVARQLTDQGQPIGRLVLLDQGPVPPGEAPADDAAYLMSVFGQHIPLSIDHLRQLDINEQVAHVLDEGKRIGWIYPDVTFEQFRHFVNILQTHAQAWRHYSPQIYSGQITLFRATDPPEHGSAGSPGGLRRDPYWQLLFGKGSALQRFLNSFRSYLRPAYAHTTADNQTPDLGWAALTSGGIEIHEVPGDHISMLLQPHVRVLARHLRTCLDSGL